LHLPVLEEHDTNGFESRAGGMVDYVKTLHKSIDNDFQGWQIKNKA